MDSLFGGCTVQTVDGDIDVVSGDVFCIYVLSK